MARSGRRMFPDYRLAFAEINLAAEDFHRPRIPRSQLFDAATARFRERVTKSGRENAHILWGEALQQVEKGWLIPPLPWQPTVALAPGVPPALTFVFASGSIRPRNCLLRRSETLDDQHGVLRARPIQLVSWDHIAQLSQLLAEKGGDWAMFKAGHEAAYKQLPLAPVDQRNAIVSFAILMPCCGTVFPGVPWSSDRLLRSSITTSYLALSPPH